MPKWAPGDEDTQKKLLDNTLVIFTSPTRIAVRAARTVGPGDASDPLNMYEEVVATPMMWSWRGHVVPLATRPEMVSAYDLVPTICDITPAELPKRNLCGRSYLTLATGKPLPKKQPWRTTVFAQHGDTAMARSDRYKLIVRNEGKGPGELYDDRADARERVNQYDNPQFMTVKTTLLAELASGNRSIRRRWARQTTGRSPAGLPTFPVDLAGLLFGYVAVQLVIVILIILAGVVQILRHLGLLVGYRSWCGRKCRPSFPSWRIPACRSWPWCRSGIRSSEGGRQY